MLNLALFVGLANDKPSPRAAVGQSAVETSQGRAGELDRRADSSTRKVAPPSCSCWLLCRLPWTLWHVACRRRSWLAAFSVLPR